jgi:hypothetical protein
MGTNVIKSGLVVLAAVALAGCASTKKAPVSYAANPPVYSQVPAQKSVLFSTFGGCGIQIWQNEWGQYENTFDIDYVNGCITVGPVGWWGGSFGCYDNGIPNGATFNLSHISKITFEASASSYGTFYMNFDGNQKFEIDVKPEFKEYTLEFSHLKAKTDFIFMIGGVRDLSDYGTKIYLKNIKFYDQNGEETVPKYN